MRRVDALRKERGWSKCKLNDEAGFSAGMIYQWYNTSRMPTVHHIEMICKAYNITLAEFFADDGDTTCLIDGEFWKIYMKLSSEQRLFMREMAVGLLKMTENKNG